MRAGVGRWLPLSVSRPYLAGRGHDDANPLVHSSRAGVAGGQRSRVFGGGQSDQRIVDGSSRHPELAQQARQAVGGLRPHE